MLCAMVSRVSYRGVGNWDFPTHPKNLRKVYYYMIEKSVQIVNDDINVNCS